MEIKFDTTILLNELKAFHLDAVKRMENMVRGFAYQLTVQASSHTPLGDAFAYRSWYKQREATTGLLAQEGLARGNWQYSEDSIFTLQPYYGANSDDAAAEKVRVQSKAYKLGETFYIGNAAPYIDSLENNYSPQTNRMGIIAPTIQQITGAYSVDLQFYYKRG